MTNNNKKIVIIVHNLTGGGAERVASLWANGFNARGYDVTVIIYDYFAPITYKLNENVKLINIGNHSKNRLIRVFYNRFLKPTTNSIRNTIKAIQPDYIIGVMQHSLIWKVSKGSKGNIIMTDHNSCEKPDDVIMSKKLKYEKFELSKKADIFTVLTEADKKVLGNDRTNVFVMPNPLTFTPLKEVPQKEKIILAAGRLGVWHYKGFDLLLKAWGKIAKNYPDWKLQIAGTGKESDIEQIKTWIKEEKIEQQTELLGYCTDMNSIFKRSSIFVLSSRYEGFGMVLTEAMACGCACITTDFRGRQSEIITSDQEGVVIQPDNFEAIASALDKVILDENYRGLIQKGALKRSEYFKLENSIDRWEDIFKIISKPKL